MKSYKVTHKFCHVTAYVEAESEEEALEKADYYNLIVSTEPRQSDCQELQGDWIKKAKWWNEETSPVCFVCNGEGCPNCGEEGKGLAPDYITKD